MDYAYLQTLKKNNPAWRLLAADTAPLIIGFFDATFIEKGIRPISQPDLVEKLDDYLYHLRDIYGEDLFPRTAREYLDDWAGGNNNFLRKYYPHAGDEPEFDLTPAAEKVIEWLKSFEKREFIGTESRLLLVFRLLEELVSATETDPKNRIAELEKKKEEIDAEIEKVKRGIMESYDDTQTKERFWQIEDTSRQLLADFRGVEENFRALDRQTREKIAVSKEGKAVVLDEIFREQEAIDQSHQGKSFKSFWAFLMSQNRQRKLDELVGKILQLPALRDFQTDSRLPGLKYHLLEAGEKVTKTVSNLNEQLGNFLDQQVWLENRRIMELIRGIEEKAIALRATPPPEKDFMIIDEIRPEIELPMSRTLFRVPEKPVVLAQDIAPGSGDVLLDVLYAQFRIDEGRLLENIGKLLQERSQVTLAEVCDRFPPQKGLGEIVTYLHIASKDDKAYIDTERTEELCYQVDDRHMQARIPLVLFTR